MNKDALLKAGYTPDETSDAVFEEYGILGTVSIGFGDFGTYKAIAITIEENTQGGETALQLPKDLIKQIAYTADILITDFGCDVASWTMKNVDPFKNLTIIKLSNLDPDNNEGERLAEEEIIRQAKQSGRIY